MCPNWRTLSQISQVGVYKTMRRRIITLLTGKPDDGPSTARSTQHAARGAPAAGFCAAPASARRRAPPCSVRSPPASELRHGVCARARQRSREKEREAHPTGPSVRGKLNDEGERARDRRKQTAPANWQMVSSRQLRAPHAKDESGEYGKKDRRQILPHCRSHVRRSTQEAAKRARSPGRTD